MTPDLPNSLEDCDVIEENRLDPGRSIRLIPESLAGSLADKRRLDYHEYRKQFPSAPSKFSKDPEKAQGYSPYTVYDTAYRTAQYDQRDRKNREGYRISRLRRTLGRSSKRSGLYPR